MARRVAIIGAGISGLLACKYTSEKGFNPIIFEAQSGAGGVWTHTVETTRLQTPRDAYQFSDFPWPSLVKEEFPDHNLVLEYLDSFTHHFDLLRYINFHSKVLAIEYEGPSEDEMLAWDLWGGTGEPFSPKGTWNVTVQNTRDQSTKVCFPFFCVCQLHEIFCY